MGEVVEEHETYLPAVAAHQAMVTRAEVSVEDVIAQRDKIKQVMERVMTDGVHFGVIPGVKKPTLFKAGAEVLNTTFRLAPSYHSERTFGDDGHLTVVSKCVLTHAPSGIVLGEGEGLCSSREAKYAYRQAKRTCPACGAEAIIKGKAEYGGGWLCWKKQDGCGAKFSDGDAAVESQEAGKVDNPELPDTWNTVLKMAAKRALVAAVLNCTAASDIFTQDVEDGVDVGGGDAGSTPAAADAASSKQPEHAKKGKEPSKSERMRDRLRVLGLDADQIRGVDAGTSLSEIEAKLDGASDEDTLARVGIEVSDWLREGCKQPFTDYVPVKF
jgi:hypothetical protein